MGPENGPYFWPEKNYVSKSCQEKTIAVWKWYNYTAASCPANKTILRVNLDESSVCIHQGQGRGNVITEHRRGTLGLEPTQKVNRSKHRLNFTYISIICDDPAIQLKIPQIIIGAEAAVRKLVAESINATAPSSIIFLRRKSSWNQVPLMKEVLRIFARAIGRDERLKRHIIFILDAARIHIKPDLIKLFRYYNINVVIVPARMTWLLQPLDTHAFASFKLSLRERFQRARASHFLGEISMEEFLRILVIVIKEKIQHATWKLPFDRDGYTQGQEHVSMYIKQILQWSVLPSVSRERPTEEDIKHIYPKNSKHIPYMYLCPESTVFAKMPTDLLPKAKSSIPKLPATLAKPPAPSPSTPLPSGISTRRMTSFDLSAASSAKSSGIPPSPVPVKAKHTAWWALAARTQPKTSSPSSSSKAVPPAPEAAVISTMLKAPPPKSTASKSSMMTRARSRSHLPPPS